MAIREDLVASAAQFLQDPSVASSTLENRVSFLRAKNLTQEEIDAALSRASTYPINYQQSSQVPPIAIQQQQQYYPPYSQHHWENAPPVPRRDWRDWFIMATVTGGVGYGLYALTKRYIYPMIAPPTPERLEQDKKWIEDQFDKTFGLVDQLARDTETLKAAEQERTARLDTALSELETVISDLKSANRRREDDAQRIRDEIQTLKGSVPKALEVQKDLADSRLKEINTELLSLKTLVTRMSGSPTSGIGSSNYLRQNGNTSASQSLPQQQTTTTANSDKPEPEAPTAEAGSARRPSPFTSGAAQTKSIPAWQLASKSADGSNTNGAATTEAASP